jgi:hypothetical protein
MGSVKLSDSRSPASSPQDRRIVLTFGAISAKGCQGCEWMQEMLSFHRRINLLMNHAGTIQHGWVRQLENEEWLAQ